MTDADNHNPSPAAAPDDATLRTKAAPTSPPMPSVHLRAFVTWLVIFPLVAIGLTLIGPLTPEWHPVLRAFVLTLVIVPLAVYVLVPRLMQLVLRVVRFFRR